MQRRARALGVCRGGREPWSTEAKGTDARSRQSGLTREGRPAAHEARGQGCRDPRPSHAVPADHSLPGNQEPRPHPSRGPRVVRGPPFPERPGSRTRFPVLRKETWVNSAPSPPVIQPFTQYTNGEVAPRHCALLPL